MKCLNRAESGFTLIELIVVISMLAILMMFATPSVRQWQLNAQYRESARAVANFLQEGRNQAIAVGISYTVSCEQDPASCEVATVTYSDTDHEFVSGNPPMATYTFPEAVMLKTGDGCDEAAVAGAEAQIEYYPNGSAEIVTGSDPFTVCVMTLDGETRFKVSLPSAATGKVSISRP